MYVVLVHSFSDSIRNKQKKTHFKACECGFSDFERIYSFEALLYLDIKVLIFDFNFRRKQSQVKSWRSERKPEHLNLTTILNTKKNLNFPAKMGVERNESTDAGNGSTTRCEYHI